MSKKVYIGVVGQIACGKGELVGYLQKKFGFTVFSLSSIVHDEVDKRKIANFTRKTLQDVGDELRKKYGRDVLAKRAIAFLNKKNVSRAVIEGIRNTAEVEVLKKLPQFTLIGVKAKRELRFSRLLKRNKEWDPITWEDFLVVDRRDLGVGQKREGQQVGKCLHYCDYVLTNNKDVKDFQRKVEKLIAKVISQT